MARMVDRGGPRLSLLIIAGRALPSSWMNYFIPELLQPLRNFAAVRRFHD